jgi:hypothetical protein
LTGGFAPPLAAPPTPPAPTKPAITTASLAHQPDTQLPAAPTVIALLVNRLDPNDSLMLEDIDQPTENLIDADSA